LIVLDFTKGCYSTREKKHWPVGVTASPGFFWSR